jgi:CubicO group peptidase (beta-lactamase class C family)
MSGLRKAGSGIAACGLMIGTLSAQGARGPQDKTAAAVDEVFADYTKAGSPGCAVAVYRDGRISYTKGYGLANIEEDVPITPQTVFDIGSTSKQFTAASILLLEKNGKLSINDEVRKYIPELPDYGQKISILNLLNHTSGLRDYLTLMELAGINTDSVTTDEDALQIIARQKALNFAPGSDWLYSNTGYFLLSIIVKRVRGKTLREFAAENIFGPLGMTHTQYRDDHAALIANRALAYDPVENGGYRLDVAYAEQNGDGMLQTSIEDLQKWDESFYSGTIVDKDFATKMEQQVKLNGGKVLDYAKGLFIADYRGLHSVSHGGAWGGYRAELLRFPEQHFSVACLCNRGDANPTRRAHQVADVYLSGLMRPREEKKADDLKPTVKKEAPQTAEQLRAYTGDYWSSELGVTYRLAIVEGKLKVVGLLDGSGSFRASTLPPDSFVATKTDEFSLSKTPIQIHFERDSSQSISGFKLDAGRTLGMIFTRRDGAGK